MCINCDGNWRERNTTFSFEYDSTEGWLLSPGPNGSQIAYHKLADYYKIEHPYDLLITQIETDYYDNRIFIGPQIKQDQVYLLRSYMKPYRRKDGTTTYSEMFYLVPPSDPLFIPPHELTELKPEYIEIDPFRMKFKKYFFDWSE